MFLADRYVVGDCPKCSAKNQYGDGCEVCGQHTQQLSYLIHNHHYLKLVPTTKTSEHIFFDLEKAKSNLVQFLDTVINTKTYSWKII